MKRLTIGASLVIFGALVASAAANFPYVDPLTSRYSLTNSTAISSFDTATPVQAVNGGMQDNENVAVIECSVANLTAIDESDWADESAKVTDPQAALSLKSKDDSSLVWMGYFGGTLGWQQLTGTATEGAYQLKIEIDYTLPTKKVRYSVKKSGDDDYTILAYGGNEWNPLGDSAKKVNGVDLYGYGTVNSASGKCGDRATLTTVATSESVDMNYSNLVVKASAKDVWGASKMTVTLKKGGEAVQTQEINIAAGDKNYEVTFDKAQAGEEYTYDVALSGYSDGRADVTKATAVPAKLFSEIEWFGFDEGVFVKATPDDKIAIDSTKKTFASVDDQVGLITPTTASSENAKTVVETVMTISSVYAWTELPDVDDTQLSIALVENAGSTGRTWAYKVGSAAWMPITSDISTESGTYTVKVEFDYASATKQATVWVKSGEVNGTGEYVLLIGNVELTENKLNTAAVMGGDVNAMNASFKTTKPVEVLPDETKHEIAVNANTEVDLKNLKGTEYKLTGATDKFHLRWKDDVTGDGKWAKIVDSKLVTQSGVPANGLDSYASYVLGLDAETETSVPAAVVQPNVDQSKGIMLHVPNVSKANLPNSGYKVMFQVQKKVGNTWENAGAPVEAGNPVSIPYADGSQRYRVNTILK